MGVDKSDYLIVGYKLPYNQSLLKGQKMAAEVWDNQELLSMLEGWPEQPFRLIMDGMSGEYIVFGRVVAEGDEYAGLPFIEIDIKTMSMADVKAKATELIGDIGEPKVILFSHYS